MQKTPNMSTVGPLPASEEENDMARLLFRLVQNLISEKHSSDFKMQCKCVAGDREEPESVRQSFQPTNSPSLGSDQQRKAPLNAARGKACRNKGTTNTLRFTGPKRTLDMVPSKSSSQHLTSVFILQPLRAVIPDQGTCYLPKQSISQGEMCPNAYGDDGDVLKKKAFSEP